jgi:hypothetical protein
MARRTPISRVRSVTVAQGILALSSAQLGMSLP